LSRRIAVAFSNMLDPSWLAGGQYLSNLLYAIKSSGLNLELVLRISPGTPKESYELLDGLIDRVIELPRPLPKWIFQLPYFLQAQITPMFLREDRELLKHHIDAQFMFQNPGNVRQVPTATWIPDFQHLYFPEFFTKDELEIRSRSYADAALRTQIVVLSSEHALNDLKKVAPDAVIKARVLRFVAHVKPDIYELDSLQVANHYHLPLKFFFLPNQLWQHKNHRIVLQALAIASKQIPELTVVCAGGTYDYRNPNYFDAVLNDMATLGLQSNFRILGRIPRSSIYPLMRQSLAVLQPSLFEGWSTTVEEVKSVGKSIILSDIPVHREQKPPRALYFDPQNPHELANHLSALHVEKAPGADIELENQARADLPVRIEKFAQTFNKIITEMVGA
jgi:glycosyltransferase involved in cell wall biosynthesis